MDILDRIEAAGVVGCGGAGFPTHKKLRGGIEYLIVNGAECEPLLRTDRFLMRSEAPRLVKTIAALGKELGAAHCAIAVKRHYREEIDALRQAIARTGGGVVIHELDSFYPAGDEVSVVYEVTGRVVPPAGLPIAVGAVVDNVATIYAVSQALEGIPFTHKYLTVTGEVRCPAVLRVPMGTSYRDCLELAGGVTREECTVVTGGPMMGRSMSMDEAQDAVVTKTASGILVLPRHGPYGRGAADLQRMFRQARSACIQCTFCSQLCPRHLLGHPLEPHRIMRKIAMSGEIRQTLHDADIQAAQLCCECGICEIYACPMGLQPREVNRAIKRELAAANIRWQAPADAAWRSDALREYRKAPSDKVAARAGVWKYNAYEIRELLEAVPGRVEIPVKMHIGAPAVPVVAAGDRVSTGQLIARVPEGALGAPVHASIDGRVESVSERIAIVRE